MYTFRFNPVFQQWVLLGEQRLQTVNIQEAHKILPIPHEAPHFQAATYPRQPFVLDQHKKGTGDDLVFAAQPPLGEYELLLYSGKKSFFEWTEKEWEQWFMLASERIRHFHLNPHLHFVTLKLHTKALGTAGVEYQRVGDLIAASHPLAGMSVPVQPELIEKLLDKERVFVVHKTAHTAVYVPSAPLNHKEVWCLPQAETAGLESLGKPERRSWSRTIALVMHVLREEFPKEQWVITLHTAVAQIEHQDQWWIQIHQDGPGQVTPLAMQPLPERFVLVLHKLLAHHSQR